VCILHCGCFNLFCNLLGLCIYGFCNVWVCVCVAFVTCGCFDNFVCFFGNTCNVLVFAVFVLLVLCFCIVSFMCTYSILCSCNRVS
jgi:hypothetical protein